MLVKVRGKEYAVCTKQKTKREPGYFPIPSSVHPKTHTPITVIIIQQNKKYVNIQTEFFRIFILPDKSV